MDANPDDAQRDARWMTFGEFAAARGINRASAIRTIRRKRWRRQKDNHGTVRALIPADWQTPSPDHPDDQPEGDPHDRPDDRHPDHADLLPQALAALENAVTGLREQLTAADARADELRVERDAARADAKTALDALDQIKRADDARKARGRLRRVWDGWRGW
jgi:hypothetical protein